MLVLEADGRAADGALGPLGRVVLAGLQYGVTQLQRYSNTTLCGFTVVLAGLG